MKSFLRCLSFLCLFLWALAAPAQTSRDFVSVKGRVFDPQHRSPIPHAQVEARQGLNTYSCKVDAEGFFNFPDLPAGTYVFTVSAAGYSPYVFEGECKTDRELGTLFLESQDSAAGREADEVDLDTEVDLTDVAPILSSSQDIFSEMAAYNFSQARFKVRGYDADHQKVYINGLLMNDMNTGSAVFSLWGGLNDVTRNQEASTGLESGNFAFGNIGGVTNMNMLASTFRPGIKFTYSLSNRTYSNRAMVTYATGLLKGGWSLAFSGTRRWGAQAYAQGTFYDAWSYFGAVEKRWGEAHTLALTFFAAPTERGVASGSTQEAYDLTGSNYYNPNVGWQNGKLRNARVRDNHEPVALLNWIWQLSPQTKLTTSAGYRWGRNGYSSLNWYDAPDPRPDYYRNLPSYNAEKKPYLYAYYTELWRNPEHESARFLDWDGMYRVNYANQNTLTTEEGQVFASGKQGKYMIEDRRTDQKQLTANMVLNTRLSPVLALHAALEYRTNRTAYFKTVKDLMGADFWLDIDQYAERDFGSDRNLIQSDLNHPNRIVKEGDTFGYHYNAHIQDMGAWARLELTLPHWDLYGGLSAGSTYFYRDGKYRKGLFPDDSYGKSQAFNFLNYGAKAGATYKMSGWHYFTANAAYLQQAPNFQDAYISPRTRNTAVRNLREEKVASADLSYHLRAPRLRGRITGFWTYLQDQTRIISFYDDYHRSFGNYTMTGIDRQYLGGELGLQYKASPSFTFEGAFAHGDYTYQSNPYYVQTVDNTNTTIEESRVYWAGYKVSGTPQTVGSLAVNYTSPRHIFVTLAANYFDNIYLDMNPVRRTDRARAAWSATHPEYIAQTQLPGGLTLDASIGCSYRIRYKYYLSINLNVSNLLDNQEVSSGGYEHMRVSTNSDTQALETPFDSRLFYMWGRNFFFNVNFRF